MGDTQQPTMGPKGMDGDGGENGFVLAKTEWLAIQRWMTVVLALPADEAELRSRLSMTADDDVSQFAALLQAYQSLRTHENTWRQRVFPSVVSEASSIYDYATTKVAPYYSALIALAEQLVQAPPADASDSRVQNFIAAAQDLQHQAGTQADSARAVVTAIDDLAAALAQDTATVRTRIEDFQRKTNINQAAVADLQNREKRLKKEVKELNKAYEKAVVIAATTATYAFVPVVGPVTAATVAGIYGKKAADLKKAIKGLEKRIDGLDDEIARDKHILTMFDNATDSLRGVADALPGASQAMGHLEGLWQAIADDIGSIVETFQSSITNGSTPAFIKQINLEGAQQAWHTIGQRADVWRTNAYIQITGA